MLKQGRFSNIGESEAIYPPHGKKLLNFSNYSLNPDNIINAQNLTDNKIYSSFLKEQIFDYTMKNEMKDDLMNHAKFTSTLRSIHNGKGTFHIPAGPGS